MSNPEQTVPAEGPETTSPTAGATEADVPVEQAATDNSADAAAPAADERIAALEKERDELKDQWLRSAAEFQNFRKREERLRVERERNANVRLIRKLIPVLDDLLRGAQHAPDELKGNDWVNGMLAIERKLWTILEQEGVSPIDSSTGTLFDPNVHEALLSEDSDEVESGHIIGELERGYRHYDSVLRPARVRVAR